MPRVQVTIRQMACQETNDAFLHGPSDEMYLRVTTGAGVNFRELKVFNLGSWDTGTDRTINLTVYEEDAQRWPYISFRFMEDDGGSPVNYNDLIGEFRLDIDNANAGVPQMRLSAGQNTEDRSHLHGATQHEFYMTGEGAQYKIWLPPPSIA